MTSEERDGLRSIRRFRFWLCVFLLSYVPVVWIVMITTHSYPAVVSFMLALLIAIIGCAIRTAFSPCPRCGSYFHSTTGHTPSFASLLVRKCTHCGLPLRADQVIYPSME
jgi:hypothetical protein